MVCKRPKPRKGQPQRLCADAGYKGDPATKAVLARRHRPHIKQRKEEADAKRKRPGYRARRWVVERTHSWLNRFRKLLVSFEKTEAGYVALLSLAAAMICWRQTHCGDRMLRRRFGGNLFHPFVRRNFNDEPAQFSFICCGCCECGAGPAAFGNRNFQAVTQGAGRPRAARPGGGSPPFHLLSPLQATHGAAGSRRASGLPPRL